MIRSRTPLQWFPVESVNGLKKQVLTWTISILFQWKVKIKFELATLIDGGKAVYPESNSYLPSINQNKRYGYRSWRHSKSPLTLFSLEENCDRSKTWFSWFSIPEQATLKQDIVIERFVRMYVCVFMYIICMYVMRACMHWCRPHTSQTDRSSCMARWWTDEGMTNFKFQKSCLHNHNRTVEQMMTHIEGQGR